MCYFMMMAHIKIEAIAMRLCECLPINYNLREFCSFLQTWSFSFYF